MVLAQFRLSFKSSRSPIRQLSFSVSINAAYLMSDGAGSCIFNWLPSLCYCYPVGRHSGEVALTPPVLSQGNADQTKQSATKDDITMLPHPPVSQHVYVFVCARMHLTVIRLSCDLWLLFETHHPRRKMIRRNHVCCMNTDALMFSDNPKRAKISQTSVICIKNPQEPWLRCFSFTQLLLPFQILCVTWLSWTVPSGQKMYMNMFLGGKIMDIYCMYSSGTWARGKQIHGIFIVQCNCKISVLANNWDYQFR